MAVIATAGHVDHGKSSLVLALTGRDPDRWAEEKRRGLTIDLGFAWAELGQAGVVAFVDVPGHHRFIANMLAGVGSVAAVLLVVAADEGWKEQSEEHLNVIDLLGIDRGVVALSKVDKVHQTTLEQRIAEVSAKLDGTLLAGASIVPVSAQTSQGLDHLREELAKIVPGAPDRHWPRMWIDRSFSVAGAGTVVTGTLVGGSVKVDDELEVWPRGAVVRVRGLESHEVSRSDVGPDQRVAMNLVGVSVDEVERGSLLARPQTIDVSDRFLVAIRPVRDLLGLEGSNDWLFHLGTLVCSARLDPLDGSFALLRTSQKVPIASGDRFVLRDTGRNVVAAGGQVLHPHPPLRRKEAELLGPRMLALVDDPQGSADALLEQLGTAPLSTLAAWTGGGQPSPDTLVEAGVAYSAVAAHRLDIQRRAAEQAKEDQARADEALDDDPGWRAVRAKLDSARFAPPTLSDLGLAPELLRRLIATGRLLRLAPDLVILPATLTELDGLKSELPEWFTVAQFRDAAASTRRVIVPLLEYLGRQGVTRRRGDLHALIGTMSGR